MSGYLAESAQGKDTSAGSAKRMEEHYERLFPKIGRDFVSKRDFLNIMQKVLWLLEKPEAFMIDLEEDSEARSLAGQYKELLDSGKDGTKIYTDLINLDDE
jgi:hypothetical protein